MERISELIGAIYDCVLDPTRWDDALEEIRRFLLFANTALYLYDVTTETQRLFKVTGVEPYWLEKMIEWGDSISEVYKEVGDVTTRPLDKIFVMRRELSDEFLMSNFYFVNWALPQGIDDLIQIALLRDAGRVSALAMGRFAKDGRVTDREINLAQILTPHLRRAVVVSDLIDLKTVEADTFEGTLDTLASGIVLVGKNGAIIHANETARAMLERGHPLRSVGGKLNAGDPDTTERLLHAVAAAGSSKGEPSDAGLGVALTRTPAAVHVAHILPIALGDVGTRLTPKAVAAIFIASSEAFMPSGLAPIAEAFGLTAAELRLLERVVQGESLDEASATLNIARTTAKTHMTRILAKTGTRRQTALLALVHQLTSAARRPTGPEGRN
jgi:DNA-binding CsgD family transcriptional regulator